MKPPQEFFDEFEPIRERIRWAQAGLGTEKQVVQGKMMLEDFREFFGRWRPQIAGNEDACRLMDDLFQKMKTMERHLHQVFWAHLNEVIEARKEWLVAEASLKATIAITVLRKEMPEKLRDGFEKILSDHSFDAEKAFREGEKEIAEAETKYRRGLAGLEIDWPERVDAALRERLEKVDMAGANGWQAEVGAQQNAVK
jgi:hypothetical protein